MGKAKIVYALRVHRSGIELLVNRGYNVVVYDGRYPPKEWLQKELVDADVLVVAPIHVVDKEILNYANRLKLIVLHGSGYENIDLELCSSKGICVAYEPDAIAEAVAEHALGLTLALLRNIVLGDRYVRSGSWGKGPAPRELLGTSLKGKTVGIIGLGRIGSNIARLFKHMGCKIIYWSRRRKPEVEHALGIEYRELHELLSKSDIVIVSIALTKDTIGFIDYTKLSMMKKNSILVNVSRGKVIVEEDLVRALKEGLIKGAALDVFSKEPIDPNNPLVSLDNVVLTPHIAGYTREAMIETSQRVAKTIIRFLEEHKKPLNPLTPCN